VKRSLWARSDGSTRPAGSCYVREGQGDERQGSVPGRRTRLPFVRTAVAGRTVAASRFRPRSRGWLGSPRERASGIKPLSTFLNAQAGS